MKKVVHSSAVYGIGSENGVGRLLYGMVCHVIVCTIKM